MTEESWFVFIIWLIVFLVSWKLNKTIIYVTGGIIGIFLGFLVMTDVYVWLGIILLVVNLYLIFYGLFKAVEEK